ncbi:LysR substrate-binding domain-containing protein [uncultured Kushneria sp.]|uniref:LysR substrate-binding domain-containing protein n=1 Tax=uncultured Kushneria sp. TaxID=905033 RepID=UPI00262DA2DA|nr:LysR substrate-binding domain-containing protein [uncultured Kushneria sp.]
MLPILSDFTRLYPEITLDLDFNDRVVDLIDEKFDAVVRAACLPDFAIHDALVAGKLERVLPDQTGRSGTFHMLWPSNRYLTSRLRVLIDHFSARLSAPSLSQ